MGPLWLDVDGCELTAEDREILAHPTVGGVILFARNYHDNAQLVALNHAIRQAARRPILIGVDQEGGRVQRFRDGFSPIPAAQWYARSENGQVVAEEGGWLMAAEVITHDIDLCFRPVLDIGFACRAIVNRAFGDDVQSVVKYSSAYLRGMKSVGMATTGKHFPGHGAVIEDSHLETPYDQRDSIAADMAIFRTQIEAGLLDAMMPAHVIYPHYDDQPASGSSFWLKQVLRQDLGFKGIVFSDDLSMEGAAIMGGPAERARRSLEAGCDMVLMCNRRESAVAVLDNLPIQAVPQALKLQKSQHFTYRELKNSERWKLASLMMQRLIGQCQ